MCVLSRPWLDKFPVIVASVAYTYLRILEDHHGPQFASLRQKEVIFVVGLLRERFQVGYTVYFQIYDDIHDSF